MVMEPWTKESWEKAKDTHQEATSKKLREKRMANVADMEMEIEFKQSERIALIDSAVELVGIFSSRPATISGEPGMTESELEFYESALAFLQMQYESERRSFMVYDKVRFDSILPE